MILNCHKCNIQPKRYYFNNLTWLECPQCKERGAGQRVGPVYGQSTPLFPIHDSEQAWNALQKIAAAQAKEEGN